MRVTTPRLRDSAAQLPRAIWRTLLLRTALSVSFLHLPR